MKTATITITIINLITGQTLIETVERTGWVDNAKEIGAEKWGISFDDMLVTAKN